MSKTFGNIILDQSFDSIFNAESQRKGTSSKVTHETISDIIGQEVISSGALSQLNASLIRQRQKLLSINP